MREWTLIPERGVKGLWCDGAMPNMREEGTYRLQQHTLKQTA